MRKKERQGEKKGKSEGIRKGREVGIRIQQEVGKGTKIGRRARTRRRNDIVMVVRWKGTVTSDAIFLRKGPITRAMSKRLQEDWARAAEEGPRVLMNLRVDF